MAGSVADSASIRVPAFSPHLYVEIIPGEGVLLLSEEGAHALYGLAYEVLAQAIDGVRDVDQIVDAVMDRIDPAEAYYALHLMESAGHISESSGSTIPPGVGAFWSGLGLEPLRAATSLAKRVVRVRALGSTDLARVSEALAGLGVRLTESDGADLEVVVTDDYLRSSLSDINDERLRDGRPWLLMKPLGLEPWLGPLFTPGRGACYRCLARRLARNRPVLRFVTEKHGVSEPPVLARAAASATVAAAAQIAAVEIARHLTGSPADDGSLAGQVLSLDVRTWATARHTLIQNPDCTACGVPQARGGAPVHLVERKVQFTRSGGFRSVAPEETLKTYEHLVSPITGVTSRLAPIGRPGGAAHVYVAGHNAAFRVESLESLKHDLRFVSSGKGVSALDAKVGALCEAVERYSGEATGAEVRIASSLRELGEAGIHPNEVMRFSDRQYRERAAWNARRSKFNRVPEVFDESARIDWTPVWSLTERRNKYLPTQSLYYGAGPGVHAPSAYCIPCSNGCASGNNLEEAVLQGLLELVERDAVAIWWYNRLRRPGVDLAGLDDPYVPQLVEFYEASGRETWALDLTTDLEIPVFAAISRVRDGAEERILIGFGCHVDARLALQRAFAEMNQMLAMAESEGPDGKLTVEDEETLDWLRTATVSNQPHLRPGASMPGTALDGRRTCGGDLLTAVRSCQRALEARGMELLVLDQTRGDVGMSVCRVVVPGLRHFWARFGSGRLYDVPVRMGWLTKPLTEEDLNPIPIFF